MSSINITVDEARELSFGRKVIIKEADLPELLQKYFVTAPNNESLISVTMIDSKTNTKKLVAICRVKSITNQANTLTNINVTENYYELLPKKVMINSGDVVFQ
jgi:hypothetical protein